MALFSSHNRRTEWLPVFLVLWSVVWLSGIHIQALPASFALFSLSFSQTPPIRSTWPSAIIHHRTPLEQPGPSYCQRLNMGILSPPVLSLCHHFICVQPAFGIWYLYQSGISDLREKQIWPFTQQVGFSDERSPVISLRSSKNLEKTAYLGGRGALNKQAVAVWYAAFALFPIKYRLSTVFFFFFQNLHNLFLFTFWTPPNFPWWKAVL